MRILMTGDTHSRWDLLDKMSTLEKPDLFIHCGDWGTHMDDRIKFEQFIHSLPIPVVTIYGNHDDVTQIKTFKAPNYKWLHNFSKKRVKGFVFMGINGNIAGRIRTPWHTTEKNIREELRLCYYKRREIDFIVSHECPRGYGDILKSRDRLSNGRHKWQKNVGWQSLLEVLKRLEPKYWLCGHIHFPQIAQYNRTIVFNAGYGARGDYILLDTNREYKSFELLTSCFRKVKRDE